MDLAAMGLTLITVASIWVIAGVIYRIASHRHDRRISDMYRAAGLEEERDE